MENYMYPYIYCILCETSLRKCLLQRSWGVRPTRMPRQDQEEISFLRTVSVELARLFFGLLSKSFTPAFLLQDDYVCLSCVAHGQAEHTERLCLAAGGFGNRMCFFENVSCADQPADLSVCVFVLEQALSVRALQEMVSASQTEGVSYWLILLGKK